MMKLDRPTKHKIFSDADILLGLTQKLTDQSIVFTNGCFDILHVGHVDYLEKAAQKGDFLVVGLNSDDSVRRLKGNDRPINDWMNRAKMLAALSFIDAVVKFEEDTPQKLIDLIIPQVLLKGSDYTIDQIVGAEIVLQNGGKVETIDFVHQVSTSAMLKKIHSI